MVGSALGAALVGLLVALPPPLCRGRVIATTFDQRLNRSPSARATTEIQAAYDALCPEHNCGTGEVYQNTTIGNNAVTWVSGIRDGQFTRATIVYSAEFLNALEGSFGAGASFGVLAHEVGHHLTAAKGWRRWGDSSHDEELRADYLAGCALARSGRPPDELENALRALAKIATPTHPSFAQRNQSIRTGYNFCWRIQDAHDRQNAGKEGFGVGAAIRGGESAGACWGYWYRAVEDVERLGPIVAPRRRSKAFSSRAACDKARAGKKRARARVTEGCTCQ